MDTVELDLGNNMIEKIINLRGTGLLHDALPSGVRGAKVKYGGPNQCGLSQKVQEEVELCIVE